MINIMLACGAGMSTSLLVTKMKKVAEEQNIEANIWAISISKIENEIDNCDCVLIGPQVRYMFDEINKLATLHGKKSMVINMIDYGTMNGKNVLNSALELLNK